MVKRMILKRIFNIIVVLSIIAVISGSIYFYTASKTQIGTISASIEFARETLFENNLLVS